MRPAVRRGKTLAPVLYPFRKPTRKLPIAAAMRGLIPGALGERVEWPLFLQDAAAIGLTALIWRSLIHTPTQNLRSLALLQPALTFLFAFVDGVYSPRISRPFQKQLLVLCKCSFFAWVAVVLAGGNTVRFSFWFALLSIFSLTVFRLARLQYLEKTVSVPRRNVLIVGAGPQERELADAFHNAEDRLRRVVGFLDEKQEGCNVLGRISDLARVTRAEFVDEIIVGHIPPSRVPWVVEEAARNRLNITVMAELFGYLPSPNSFECAGESILLKIRHHDSSNLGQIGKRGLDIFVSLIGLFMMAPFLAAIAVVIKLDSDGPAFYRSRRAGKKGGEFNCYKFRTMVSNAEALKEGLREQNERSGPFFKIAADPRITRAGRWLRRYSLDELPQLWNVLRGDMSLVGPRPHPLDDVRQYRLEHLKRLDVTPGLTGLWQVTARSNPSFQQGMTLDLDYMERWSIWLDLKILLQTLRVVFNGSGA